MKEDSIVVKYECIYSIYIHVPDGIKKVLSYVINDSYNPLHNLNVKMAYNKHKQVCSGKIQVQ